MPTVRSIHRARRPQIEELFALLPIAAARQVVAGAARWLCVPLPERYATRLAIQARRCYARSELFRKKICRPGDKGRDLLYVFMRHWLAARLKSERPSLYARLPRDYDRGAELPVNK